MKNLQYSLLLTGQILIFGKKILLKEKVTHEKKKKFVHSGNYVAEVEVELIQDDHPWAPYLKIEDAKKLDLVKSALKDKNLTVASKFGRIYELKPVSL